jgi:hypothetical protein
LLLPHRQRFSLRTLGWRGSLSVRDDITHLTRRDCNEKSSLQRIDDKNV